MEAKQEVPSWLESLAYEHQHKSNTRGRSKRYTRLHTHSYIKEQKYKGLETFHSLNHGLILSV